MDESLLHYGECRALPKGLIPGGTFSADVLRALAPAGWDACPLKAAFHPSVEQVYVESVRMHLNIEALARRDSDKSKTSEPTRDEFAAGYRETGVEPLREAGELLKRCLWDVFSDNHEVLALDGRVADFGSFRACAALLAEWCNRHLGALREAQKTSERYGCMDFYMGTIWVASRADLIPVYEFIFAPLEARGYEWRYHLPRLILADMRPLLETLGKDKQDWADYSTKAALAREGENAERDRAIAEMRAQLDAVNGDVV